VLDLCCAGGLEDSDWWLAIYVMLTRGRKLENLILLGFTDQVEELLRSENPPCCALGLLQLLAFPNSSVAQPGPTHLSIKPELKMLKASVVKN